MPECQAFELGQIDWKLVVSIFAAVISISTFVFNAYFQVLRKPKLSAATGDIFTLGYGSNGELLFHRPLTFFNDGARYAAIISVRGTIFSETDKERCVAFRWRSFIESCDIGEKGKNFKPHFGFKSWPSTIIVGGHSAENENIGFKTNKPFELTPGKYVVQYSFFGHQGLLASLDETFTVTDNNCTFLHEKCRTGENRIRENTLTLIKDID